MFISQEEIQNFYSQISISPNIVFNFIQSLNNPLNNSSIRINYLINENDEILYNNEKYDNFYNFLLYEIFIIKIDFIKNKSKMIIIYNNENKEYNIKIWASKLEKTSIKDEYNKIIKKLCLKNKSSNNILKKVLQLKPDKYTIYYFPLNIYIFEQELVFIYIYFITQKEKSNFQNYIQIKDLIFYSKSILLNKINDFLLKNKNKNLKYIYNKQTKYNINLGNFIDNKENILINNIKNNNYISPKNQEIKINFNSEKFKRIINKSKKNNSKKNNNYMRKPYNKILFNYSFEKNDNDLELSKINNQRKSFIETKSKISSIIIDTYKSKNKNNNFISFNKNKLKKLNNKFVNGLPFSFSPKNNCNNFPYEKKRPNSIKNKINHYLSSNNCKIKYKNIKSEKDNDSINHIFSTFNNNSISFKSKKGLYKRKNLSKNKSKEIIDSNYLIKKLNCLNISGINYSTYNNIDTDTIFNKNNYSSIILDKNKQKNNLIYNNSILSIKPLKKTYAFIMDDNNEKNINNISINKKSFLKINDYNSINNTQLNNGNKTTRNIMNREIRKQLIYKNKIKLLNKNKFNKISELQKINDNEEEISLFL